jgi:thiol-disulfide isomerase/thioredoxin
MMRRMTAAWTRVAATILATTLSVAIGAWPASAAGRFKPFRYSATDGRQIALTDVLGRTTLVVFFFPSCPYCNAAFAGIEKLQETYKDRGLVVVWINVVPEEDRLISEWQRRHAYDDAVLLGGEAAQHTYSVRATPTYYLLDGAGGVISTHAGYKAGDEHVLDQSIRVALDRGK